MSRDRDSSLSVTELSMDPPNTRSKRKRTQTPQTEANETIILDEPWFEDGNVIIQAQNSHFKVHRGVLSSRSSIFKDMFAMGTPEEQVDSCAIVHLSDQVQNVRHMLKAIYDRRYAPRFRVSRP